MDSRCFNSVCPFVRDAFSKLLQAIPKSDLSTYVLCLMMYLMSYDLYHMSYLMSYIIWSHGFGLCLVFRTYDLMTRVDALYLPSTGHLLRILIPLEEPPHLTADIQDITLQKMIEHHEKPTCFTSQNGHIFTAVNRP